MPVATWIWVTEIAEDKVSDHKFPGKNTLKIWLSIEAWRTGSGDEFTFMESLSFAKDLGQRSSLCKD